MKRGVLTDSILVELEQIITDYVPIQYLKLLRLLPFIDYTVKNTGVFKREQLNDEEFAILTYLVEKRHLDLSLLTRQTANSMMEPRYKIKIREYEFYHLMQKALWFSYVEKRLPWEK